MGRSDRCCVREADKHPSRKYFIYKSIINNLYGVDIMEEATEICKLRLFLKLVSQVEQFNHIEPLPDIDFNIRAGNTLVGFASYEGTKRAIEGKTVGKGAFQGQMIFDDRLERIERHLLQCHWGYSLLPHSQLSVHHAEAGAFHALCPDGCLPWSSFPGRLVS